jgi:hypothetical protein
MPNFNPQEQSSLLGLLSALQSGLPGSQGYSLLQGVLGQQQNRLAARDERVGSLIDMITNAAGSGQSYEAAQALAGAYSAGSNIPPRVEDALGSLYPDASMAGGAPGPGYNETAAQQGVPSATSPIYQQQPMSPQDQLAQVQLGQTLQDQQATSTSGPMIANALANQALGFVAEGQDPNTVAANLVNSKTFQGLDPVTQQMTLQAFQDALTQTAQPAVGPATQQAPAAPGYNVGGGPAYTQGSPYVDRPPLTGAQGGGNPYR